MGGYLADIAVNFIVNGESDSMELTCPTDYSYTPERQEIAYTEYVDDVPHATRVVVEDNRVDILRGGLMDLHLSMDGSSVSDTYELEFGTIMVEYRAESIVPQLTEQGGSLSLRYTMDLGGELTRNSVEITVRRTLTE